MFAILNFLNAHSLPSFQPILMILVSKFMVHRALSDKTYFLLGLLSTNTRSEIRFSRSQSMCSKIGPIKIFIAKK